MEISKDVLRHVFGGAGRSTKTEVIEALRATKSAADDLAKSSQSSSSDAMLPMVMMMMMRKR